jgi:hypothetical protein
MGRAVGISRFFFTPKRSPRLPQRQSTQTVWRLSQGVNYERITIVLFSSTQFFYSTQKGEFAMSIFSKFKKVLKMKSLLATMNKSVLSKYEPLAAAGALLAPHIPKDHYLVLIAFTHSGLQSQYKEALTKEILSNAIKQMLEEYKLGKYSIEKKGDEYNLYEV